MPHYIPVNHESPPNDVVAMDPGIRTFMTKYDTNNFCTEWGAGEKKRVFSLFTFG